MLLRRLAPSLQLDGELVAGFRMTDCYRLSDSEPVRIELQRAGESLEIDVVPASSEGSRRAPASIAGLELCYRTPSAGAARFRRDSPPPVEDALAACTALAALLERSLGPAPRRWQVAAPSLRELPDAVADEVRCEEVELDADPDANLLRRDFRSYVRLFGARPRALQIGVRGERVPGLSLHYPPPARERIPAAANSIEVSLRVSHRRRMRAYFGALGFAFDEAAYLRTIPTPTTYTRVLAQRPELARIRPRMIANHRSTLWHVAWAVMVSRNVLPISVAPTPMVMRHALVSRVRERSDAAHMLCDVGMPVHDIGVHAAAMHAVPREAWDELIGLAIDRVRSQPLRALGHQGVLARLAIVFEGPVTKACWRAWYAADEPSDFAERYAEEHGAVIDELRRV